jgi:hypothetical protein
VKIRQQTRQQTRLRQNKNRPQIKGQNNPRKQTESSVNQAGLSLRHDIARPQGNPARHRKKSEKACDAIIAGILK